MAWPSRSDVHEDGCVLDVGASFGELTFVFDSGAAFPPVAGDPNEVASGHPKLAGST